MDVKRRKRRADLLLIAGLLALALGLLVWQHLTRRTGAAAVIYIDGVRTASYSLAEDREITVETPDGETNTFIIENGQADMVAADCPDKLCVYMRPIRYDGESIICLPHRLELRIEGGEKAEVDLGP